MRSALLLLTILLIVLVVPVAWAGTTITQVTANSIEDSLPHVKGNFVVWQGYDGSDWEVFLYNMVTGTTIQITDNDEDDVSAQTDGHYVVWRGYNGGEWDVFIWDGSQTQRISDRGAEETFPQIANGWVVWASQISNDGLMEPGEIFLYDANTQTRMALSAEVDPGNHLDDKLPMINDEAVIWVQGGNIRNTTIYMYRPSDGKIIINPDGVKRASPRSDGNLRVSTRHDGQDGEIFLYSSYSRQYRQITDNSLADRYPGISGNNIAWMADGEIFLAECQYVVLIGPNKKVVLSTRSIPTFTWECVGYDKSRVEFSKNSDLVSGDTLALPSGEQVWLAGNPLKPTKEEWESIVDMVEGNGTVYWRVIAEDAGGNLGFSETRDFVISRTGGAGQATGITDGGSDPLAEGNGISCFIATAADGQPGGSSGWIFPLSLMLSATAALTPIVL
ncbi:MAG: hypothetical protein JRF69_07130, partial [Deltaproteobacteria bacterium]|nr:hypothetical protein [Deltaproteobacteria bacterium]